MGSSDTGAFQTSRKTTTDNSPRDAYNRLEALSRRQSLLIWVFSIACIAWLWLEGTVWLIGGGAVLVAALLITYSTPKIRWTFVFMAVLTVVFVAVALPNFIKTGYKPPDAILKQNTHSIQLAVERYKVDNGVYPYDMDQLRTEGYMARFPDNPLVTSTRTNYLNKPDVHDSDNRRMRELRGGKGSLEGNFIYLPSVSADINGNLQVTGYELMVFGKERICRHFPHSSSRPLVPVILRLHGGNESKPDPPGQGNGE